MGKIESATKWMINLANDDSHGYDQINRWGLDYDCSSAVIAAWEQAGVPVRTKGAIYTGNMLSVFLQCGFTDVTSKVTLSSGVGVVYGDVLLNTVNHTAMSIGSGNIVNASINEKGTTTGGKIGDQTGKEICIRTYYNYPWNYVLRYTEESSIPVSSVTLSPASITLAKGETYKLLATINPSNATNKIYTIYLMIL